MSNYIDHKGITWIRSDDKLSITSSEGFVVLGNEEMTDEYLVSFFYKQEEPVKTDAERIAELEAKIASMLEKLNSI